MLGVAVQQPGNYRMKVPATIEQNGLGENSLPANFCVLTQQTSNAPVSTRIHIHVDRKTRQVQVRDPAWKDYQLKDGDTIALPIAFL